MKTRRSFLAAVASGGVALSLASAEPAAAQSSSGSAAPSSSAKPPSAAALAAAVSMRAFDAGLSDAEVAAIAAGIDANRAGAQLNPKKKPLKNETGPDVHFAVRGDEA
jgi:hypothetical protein